MLITVFLKGKPSMSASRHYCAPVNSCCLLALLLLAGTVSGQAITAIAVPVPAFNGPLPVTETSWPLMAVSHTQTPVDLSQAGYTEEEFLVSGSASVYDWAPDGALSVLAADAPYTTRILVRRPVDTAAFSGNVIVETVNNARNYDWAFIWALSYRHFMDNGDIYVAVTHKPEGLAALRTFDPQRYSTVSFANPQPEQVCGPQQTSAAEEEGLRWDMISQVGALLRSPTGPLAGFDIKRLIASTHTRELTTYANAVHRISRLDNGNPVYDGFLIKSEYDDTDRINRCAPAPAEGDPRRTVHNAGVPVIRVTAQGDVLNTHVVRREDSDQPGDRYRLWEVAGAPHMDKLYYDHMPVIEDQTRAGQVPYLAVWPMAYACTPSITLLDFPVMRVAVNAAFAALIAWISEGTPPPRAERIALSNPGTNQVAYVNDEYGNALGGVRSVWVDVPTATWVVNNPGPGVCNNLGSTHPFSWAKLEALYVNSDNYLDRARARLDSLVTQGWLTPADRIAIEAELSR
jgi:hypothetical protein